MSLHCENLNNGVIMLKSGGDATMRRFIFILVGVLMLCFSSVANANYPIYLNGDRNLILCDGHMGMAWYVDRTTLNVQKYEPPQYIITVNVVSASSAYNNEEDFYNGGKGKIKDVRRMRFFYNWDLRKMYIDTTGKDGWRLLSPNGSWAESGVVMPAGELAFYLAYNMKFYGCFGDEFYGRV